MATSLLTSLKRLQGKVALITGGASGIGGCTAKLFASHGAKVVVADIQEDLGRALCENTIGSFSATFVRCDVTVESDIENAVNTVVSNHGKLDIMLNNAGTINRELSILESTVEEFERVVKVNLVGAFLGTKHAARVMVPARSGSIISMSSLASVVAGITPHAYTSSKHAIVGLMKNAAAELGRHKVRVNCVSPSGVATPLAKEFGLDEEGVKGMYSNLKGRCCTVEDVAAAALYLGSDEAKYVSGVNLVVDGGVSIMNSGLYQGRSQNKNIEGAKFF